MPQVPTRSSPGAPQSSRPWKVWFIGLGAAMLLLAIVLQFVVVSPVPTLSKELATNNAKQVGEALRMYSEDYDRRFPPPEKDVATCVSPYLRDRTILQGFVYLLDEARYQAVARSTNRSAIRVGYIAGIGGRAYILADGHVEGRATKRWLLWETDGGVW
jgi:hypothetical protein